VFKIAVSAASNYYTGDDYSKQWKVYDESKQSWRQVHHL